MMSDPAIFDYSPYSAGSSGYGSGEESPFAYNTDESYVNGSLNLMHAIQHDHKYTSQTTNYTIFGSPRQADLLVNNYFKKEPPPVLYQSQFYANALPYDQLLENNFNAVDVAFEKDNPNVLSLENPNSSSAMLIQPINQLESPNINNFNNPVCNLANPNVYNIDTPNVCNPQYPNVFADVEMSDLGNSPNELYADKNEDNQELIGEESFYRDDGFFEALRELGELMDDLIPKENDTINEVTQSCACKVYELRIRHYLSGKTVLEFEPKLRDFRMSDIKAHDPSTYMLICDSETTQLMSSCIHEDMKLMENGHLSLTLKYKELVK